MKNSCDQPSPPLAGTAMERILEDQEEFEKEHQFMQVCVRNHCTVYFTVLYVFLQARLISFIRKCIEFTG